MSSAWSLLWFLVILALIPACLWLLKRSPYGAALGASPAAAAPMRLVSGLALGPGQRLVTVEVGQGDARQWLVLGVTAHGINALHTLPAGAELPPTTAHPGFAALLRRAGQDRLPRP